MIVSGIDHINIRTGDVAGTARMFEQVLGLRSGAMPGVDPDKGQWLYDANDRAIIHVNDAAMFGEQPKVGGTGALHHIAFACIDRAAMVQRLSSLGVEYEANEVPQAGVRQLFIRDPNGVLLELNFQEAAPEDVGLADCERVSA